MLEESLQFTGGVAPVFKYAMLTLKKYSSVLEFIH